MTRQPFAALLALAVSLALLSACGGSPAATAAPTADSATSAPAAGPTAAPLVEPTAAPLAEPTAAPAAPVAAAPADVRAAIAAAVAALEQRGPYRMTISSTTDAGTAELLVVPPDRSHFKASMQGVAVEVISIGDTSYVLNPDGAWQTVASDESGIDSAAPISAADLADITDPQALGKQTVNGVSATGYRFGSAADPSTTSTIWVGPDGAPVQLVAAAADGETTFDIAYDASITVEPPAL